MGNFCEDVCRLIFFLGDKCVVSLGELETTALGGLSSLAERWLGYTLGLDMLRARAPRAKRGPGASSNMTDFQFSEVQNKRRKCWSLVRKMM